MSDSRKSEGLNEIQQYKTNLTNQLLGEIFGIVQAEEKAYGHEFADEFVMSLLQSYIATCVFNSLRNGAKRPAIDNAAQYTQTMMSYGRMKVMIQEAVAQGFAQGMHCFNPQAVPDYLCTVKPLDDGIARAKPS